MVELAKYHLSFAPVETASAGLAAADLGFHIPTGVGDRLTKRDANDGVSFVMKAGFRNAPGCV